MGVHSSAADPSSTIRRPAPGGGSGKRRSVAARLLAPPAVVAGIVALLTACSATYSGTVAEPSSTPEVTTTTPSTSVADQPTTTGGEVDGEPSEPTIGEDIDGDADAGNGDVGDGTAGENPAASDPVDDPGIDRPPLPVVDWAAFEARLLDGWTDYRGLTAAAVVDGEVVWTAARGEADPGMRFRIASLSKVLTAIVIHQLVAEGRLALDQPVGALAAAALGVGALPPRSEALTPAMLLSHRSGFDKYEAVFFKGVQGGDWRGVAARGLTDGPGGDPAFVYSNMNYVVLGVLIEAVTGLDYEQAVRTRVLDPLGAGSLRLAGTHDVREGDAHHWSGPTRNYMEMLGPAGAWIGTAADMALVLGSLAPGGVGPGRPLEAEGLESLRVPGAYGPLQGGSYAHGGMFDGRGAFGHTGSVENSRTMGMVTPDGVAWVVLVNGKEPERASAIGERVWAALDVARR